MPNLYPVKVKVYLVRVTEEEKDLISSTFDIGIFSSLDFAKKAAQDWLGLPIESWEEEFMGTEDTQPRYTFCHSYDEKADETIEFIIDEFVLDR